MCPPQPSHAHLLVGVERRAQLAAVPFGAYRREGVGRAKAIEDLLHPGPGLDAGPGAGLLGKHAARVATDRPPSQQTHRLVKGHPITLDGLLDPPPVIEYLAKAFPVSLDPSALDEDEAVGGLQERPALLGRERVAVEGELHGEIEHGVGAELRWGSSPHRYANLRPWWRFGAPPVGDAHDHARLLERRHLLEEGVSFARGPAQGLIDVPPVDHRADQGTLFRGALDRKQKREEPLAIAGDAGLLERVPEWTVLRCAFGREASRVRR